MTSRFRIPFLAFASFLGACGVAPTDGDVEKASFDDEGPILASTTALSVTLSAEQVRRLRELCDGILPGTTPELSSPGRDATGALTLESAVWKKVRCVSNSQEASFVWERVVAGATSRMTFQYDLLHQSATVENEGTCSALLAPSHGGGANYTCAEAGERLRVWLEGDKNVKFISLHGGCRDVSQSRTGACTSAAHHFCANNGYGGGMTQEVGPNDFGVGCFDAPLYQDVSATALRGYHPGCVEPNSPDCMAAVHRFCNASGYTGGLIQEYLGEARGVACFAGEYFIGDMGTLTACTVGNTSGADCTAAAHRFCNARGYTGGLVQEVSPPALGIACFGGGYFGATLK